MNKFNPIDDNFSAIQKKQGLSNEQVYGVLEDKQGFLWIITNYGLNRYEPQSGAIKLFTESDGLQNNEFNQGGFQESGRTVSMMFGGVNGFQPV